MPGMVNVRAAPPVKVPAVIVTVNTGGVPTMAAVPAPPIPPAMKVRVPAPTMASPAPLRVMMIFPVEGMVDAGVRDTVMVTPVAPLLALLRMTAGLATPSVPVMATKVPVVLVSMATPAPEVVAAAMVVDAA